MRRCNNSSLTFDTLYAEGQRRYVETSSQEFAILTNEIMQGTFALKVDEYKQVPTRAR